MVAKRICNYRWIFAPTPRETRRNRFLSRTTRVIKYKNELREGRGERQCRVLGLERKHLNRVHKIRWKKNGRQHKYNIFFFTFRFEVIMNLHGLCTRCCAHNGRAHGERVGTITIYSLGRRRPYESTAGDGGGGGGRDNTTTVFIIFHSSCNDARFKLYTLRHIHAHTITYMCMYTIIIYSIHACACIHTHTQLHSHARARKH